MLRSNTWAQIWSVIRVLSAALLAAAVVRQLVNTLEIASSNGRDIGVTLVNYFSYFTILSNLLSVIVLLWAAMWFWFRRRDEADEPPILARVLAATTTYMVVTGIVYNTLLRGIPLAPGTSIAWTNEVLHVVGPIILALDLFLGPLRRRLPWRAVATMAGLPIVWVAYTLIRGPLTTNPVDGAPYWYPYPFLNPNNFAGGYAGVSVYIIGIAIAVLAVGVLVIWIGRRRGASVEEEEAAEAAEAIEDATGHPPP
ncbi:Pr6Pr family membrane protein [Microbacterium deminutum]|uniref:Pr6Pr family membrane protein n=1 Tax=Microbacterium deminutum TaxID=344164 RepID=A0ABN2QMN7_9MICO